MNFRRLFSAALLLLLFVWGAAAQVVSTQTAAAVARNLYLERAAMAGKSGITDVQFSETFTVSEQGQPVYYIFNVAGKQGFVIVSAEERAVPVLSYSFEGSYDPAWQPENYSAWMANYQRQIVDVRKFNRQPEERISRMWTDYLGGVPASTKSAKAVSPLTDAIKWDQGCYYNAQCPVAAGGDCNRCPTGCLATAMAIIMKYHAYPTHGYSSHSYDHSIANGFAHNYGTLSANFASTTYNWSSMPNQVNSSNSAVATIMFHCGVSVNMNYDVYGSGAYLNSAAYAMNYYFIYNADYYTKSMYSDTDWKNMLKTNLDQSRPVLYCGQDPSGGGGHAFVCDGYQGSGNDYFHFNWGWSGYYNSYEYLDDIVPGGTGTGGGTGDYTSDQEALMNIYPDPAVMPVANFTSNKTNIIANDFVIFTDQSQNQPLDWTWSVSPSANTSFIAGTNNHSTNPKIRFAAAGDYSITLTVSNAAGTDTETKTNFIHVSWGAGIDDGGLASQVSVYPNPCNSVLYIDAGTLDASRLKAELYTITGSLVMENVSAAFGPHGIRLDVSQLGRGLYFLKITAPEGSITRKIEITR